MTDVVSLRDIPPSLVDSATEIVRQYTVAFVRLDVRPDESGLVGSGTLVKAENSYAILTAHHVVRALPRVGRLGVLLEKTRLPHTIDTEGLAFLEIARGTEDSAGPDLGAVVLAPSIASAIAAKKVFHNLDSRRDETLTSPPHIRDGFWVTQGFLGERTVVFVDPDGQGSTKKLYNFSGVGGPEESVQVGDHDYFEFPVNQPDAPGTPRNWGGMSGGGLWQVPLKRDGGELVGGTPVLAGVVFYQQPTTDTECGVRCHGRTSVYQVAYEAIRQNES